MVVKHTRHDGFPKTIERIGMNSKRKPAKNDNHRDKKNAKSSETNPSANKSMMMLHNPH